MSDKERLVLALAGGVGGAKLANGLAGVLTPEELVIAVNTGDDFEHLGMHISPDLDSVMYRLAGLNDTARGWGVKDESWQFMAALGALGGETWFNLGDRDLATHVERTRRLAAGDALSSVTAALCSALGIAHTVTPMSDEAVRTFVLSGGLRIPFQRYFVEQNCKPVSDGFVFDGSEEAKPAPALATALAAPELAAIVICPSNPFVSIRPILSIPAVSQALARRRVPVVAVSPLIGGAAVKGPAAKMMAEQGLPVSSAGIATAYGDIIDGLVIDSADAGEAATIEAGSVRVLVTETLMQGTEEEERLALSVLEFAAKLRPRGQ
ncbi:MAG: 2-phospho-L-lactate transferase [Alphaproteobacteria bacterium]